MIINTTNKISYICGYCGNGVRNLINIFSFSDKQEHPILCPACGAEPVSMQKLKNGKYKLGVECAYCTDTHTRTLSKNGFWSGHFGSLDCPCSGFGSVFYSSSDKQLNDSIQQVFKTLESFSEPNSCDMEDTIPLPDILGETTLYLEMLNILESMKREQDISCICGCTDISLTPKDDSVMLTCRRCGKSKIYNATKDKLLELINASCIVLTD